MAGCVSASRNTATHRRDAMDSEALCYLSLGEVGARIRDGKLSSREVTRYILDRIHQHAGLNGYITVIEESAQRAAAVADEEIRAGRWRSPLHGVPVAVKDLC